MELMTTVIQTHRRLPSGVRAIGDVAAELGIGPDLLEPYGEGVAKIRLEALAARPTAQKARYVLVTAITPTPLGEGKTVTAIGLGDGLRQHRPARRDLAPPGFDGPHLRASRAEPRAAAAAPWSPSTSSRSISPATCTRSTAAHNLLAAMVDNHLYHGNALGIDPHNISWRRVLDVDDRALRNLVIGLGRRRGRGPAADADSTSPPRPR